uniref:Uncharacterized protein n=1 Tax=Romanomermis culicivorax TaxID=13658 RepID=A0A915JG32_ROMCU
RHQDWVHYESVCEVPVKDNRKIFVAINYGWHRCRSGWPIVEKCVVSYKGYNSYTYAPETYMCANKTLSKEWFSSIGRRRVAPLFRMNRKSSAAWCCAVPRGESSYSDITGSGDNYNCATIDSMY